MLLRPRILQYTATGGFFFYFYFESLDSDGKEGSMFYLLVDGSVLVVDDFVVESD